MTMDKTGRCGLGNRPPGGSFGRRRGTAFGTSSRNYKSQGRTPLQSTASTERYGRGGKSKPVGRAAGGLGAEPRLERERPDGDRRLPGPVLVSPVVVAVAAAVSDTTPGRPSRLHPPNQYRRALALGDADDRLHRCRASRVDAALPVSSYCDRSPRRAASNRRRNRS